MCFVAPESMVHSAGLKLATKASARKTNVSRLDAIVADNLL